mmetsp:Transcript_47843/g.76338  ORF Transcript_47843/g.76338 Transcript_47843/m.76338 type:complete len:106 (+) Transcript_47843:88-405(+)
MLLSLNLISVSMLAVVFTFVKNRCGDHFEQETQFDVRFSSDSESDNDWEIEETFRPAATGDSGIPNQSRMSVDSYDVRAASDEIGATRQGPLPSHWSPPSSQPSM